MKRLSFVHYFFAVLFFAVSGTSVIAQQPPISEKEALVTKFRALTGANNVNLGINVSFEDIKNDLVSTVDNDKELTEVQKQELRKAALEAYDRLDNQLKAFLNDRPKITIISERSVYQVYDEAFSESELRELVAFYSTTAGQKALKFLPTLSAQVQKAFQAMLIPKVQEFITPKIKAEGEQLNQKIKEAKTTKP